MLAIVAPIAVNAVIVSYSYGKTLTQLQQIQKDVKELQELHPRGEDKK